MFPSLEAELELPLLKTKLSIPLLPQGFVHRFRLIEQIEQGVRGPLTLVCAPAGFGKTLLLAEWATQHDIQSQRLVVWLTLDRQDNDLDRFFRYLISAFQALQARLGEETLDFIQSTKSGGIEMGLTLLINEVAALPHDVILVLDEFHVLEEPVILQSFNFLLKHLPPTLHLVLAGRREPALDIAFLRAKGQITELGADALRFTNAEISLFFKQTLELELPVEAVAALQERTEGWITALQLAAISLRNQSDPLRLLKELRGDTHYLVDFLSEEVLSRQTEEVRQFLLKSAILDILCGPLCEAVVEPTAPPGYGATMLEQLEHANLFLSPLDPQHEWFRYHHLFADFLRHVQSETHAEEIPALHRRAATWFEAHGNLDEAFKHALASADAEWAARLIERHVETLIKVGNLQTLTHWIGQLPGEVVHRHPTLGLTYVWGSIAAYQLDNARYWLDDVQRSIESLPQRPAEASDTLPNDDPTLRSLYGSLAICRSTLALMSGDVQQAAAHSREAVQYLHGEENPFVHSLLALEDSLYLILSGDTVKAVKRLQETARIARASNNLLALVVAYCQLAETQAMQGRLSQALVTLQKAQFVVPAPDENPLMGIVDIEVGEILHERGLLAEAREHLERGIWLTKSWWAWSSMDGIAALACLLQSQGDLDGAQRLIAEAYQLALSTESSQWDDVLFSALAARMALQRHDLPAAIRWLRHSGVESVENISREAYPYHIWEYIKLTQARFYLVWGQETGNVQYLQQARDLLRSLLPQMQQFQRLTSQIETLVLQALVEDTAGETTQAVVFLLHALALGEPENYRRIFVDEGPSLTELLTQCRQVQQDAGSYLPSLDYIEGLLTALNPAATTAAAASSGNAKPAAPLTVIADETGPITLSAREIEVLTLMAEGKSNQEIASELYLTLNTVKRHAYNIYAKLDVHKRTHAIAKARQWALIP
ncbi:MAG TPA: LuxR C-terminal-related transcriptional regulator [Anaerolineae bacterium]|nr:LuxR C-terminal-related transcriptional regulator [Anaerolineae bacterium]HQH38325.1 LuxR C-terminal-related transcriptional regulator [Anaerolineae bacterium]